MIKRRTMASGTGWVWGMMLWVGMAGWGSMSAWGQLVREENTTLKLPKNPPVFGFGLQPAFGGLRFQDPVAITAPPGETNQLFVVEQRGRVIAVTNLANPTRTVFLDLTARTSGGVPSDERGLLGFAFHPDYERNRLFFVYYTTTGARGPNRVSRFEASADGWSASAASETVLIEQADDAFNHNGGDLHFGPDGYLYVSTGDEGAANDTLGNSQRITRDFFAGILRIDVDRRAGNLEPNPHAAIRRGADGKAHYLVPSDNPFVGVKEFLGQPVNPEQVRTEFWAVGLRNPWRMTFDPATGDLLVADVGQDRREEINRVVRGGNYGWNFREGTLNGPRTAPAGFVSIPPLLEYSHGTRTNQGNSVTGGVVYRGNRLSQLVGAYVFADYVSGNIWAMRHDGMKATSFQWLTRAVAIAGFGVDPRNGDVLLADQSRDVLQRLVYTGTSSGETLPLTLSGTGAFADLGALIPERGIVPYELNVPFWSDGAVKRRWFSLPRKEQRFRFDASGEWGLPEGAVWIKHFDLVLDDAAPEKRRRLETRFLVRNEGGVYGLTYRWNAAQSDAELVPEEGMDEEIEVLEGGRKRVQAWRYPSRGECVMCHTRAGGWALGFGTAQLNRVMRHGAVTDGQIQQWMRAGYFEDPQPTGAPGWAKYAAAGEEGVSLEWRARSYLSVNCAQCHQPGGPARGNWDARTVTALEMAGIVGGGLVSTGSGTEHRVVVPGRPELSALALRIRHRGVGQMPPLATTVVDEVGVALLERWIREGLAGYEDYGQWRGRVFGEVSDSIGGREADPDGDLAGNGLEWALGGDPKKADDILGFRAEWRGDDLELQVRQRANRGVIFEEADDLGVGGRWRVTEAEGNGLEFPAEDRVKRLRVGRSGEGARYYRVRVVVP